MIIVLKNANFSASNIGTLSTWRITRSIGAGASYDGPISVDKGAACSAVITLAEGYEIGAAGVTVTMGGVALVEGEAYSINENVITITIAEVTGNVIIVVPTKVTFEEEPTYTFTINPNPTNATVIIDGIERTTVDVVGGTLVTWSVSADGYITQMGTEAVTSSYAKDIVLEEIVEVIPEEYLTFATQYGRASLTETQKNGVASFLYKLKQQGILDKVRQLYMPCIMPDWDHCFLNVARYFNEAREEYVTYDLYSNSTLGRCFEVCDYGIYKTTDAIQWGDCLVSTWTDTDVTFDNWHILAFKPAQQDASTVKHSGGLNLRGRNNPTTNVNFAIGGSANATLRQRGSWNSGTVTINGEGVAIKDKLFTFPVGWGNGTYDPYCVGLSIKDNKLITPSSNYQEFGYNNRNLVNQIDEMELTGQYELPTTAMTGLYGWGGYCGASISTQQSLATSIVSIGQGLTTEEIQNYMDAADELMEILQIKNNNWNPDALSTVE